MNSIAPSADSSGPSRRAGTNGGAREARIRGEKIAMENIRLLKGYLKTITND